MNKKKNKSVRDILIRYVQMNGPATHSKLRDIVLIVNGQPLSKRHYGSSYIDRVSVGQTALLPTDTDPQYLKKGSDGLYYYVSGSYLNK